MLRALYLNIEYQIKVSYRYNILCYLYNVCACDQQYYYRNYTLSFKFHQASECVPQLVQQPALGAEGMGLFFTAGVGILVLLLYKHFVSGAKVVFHHGD